MKIKVAHNWKKISPIFTRENDTKHKQIQNIKIFVARVNKVHIGFAWYWNVGRRRIWVCRRGLREKDTLRRTCLDGIQSGSKCFQIFLCFVYIYRYETLKVWSSGTLEKIPPPPLPPNSLYHNYWKNMFFVL